MPKRKLSNEAARLLVVADSIVVLQRHRHLLHASDSEFASSLLQQYDKYGYFTSKQQPHVVRLANKCSEVVKNRSAMSRAYAISKSGISKDTSSRQKNKQQISNSHYIYAIRMGDSVKIGHSISPQKRLHALQTANPEKLELVWKYNAGELKNAKRVEKRIHNLLYMFRLNGEWFNLDKSKTDLLEEIMHEIDTGRKMKRKSWNAKKARIRPMFH